MSDLQLKQTIEDVVSTKQELVERIAAAAAEIKACRQELERYKADPADHEITRMIRRHGAKDLPTYVQIQVDKYVWHWLVSHTHLGQFMTSEQRQAFADSTSDSTTNADSWDEVKYVPLTVETAQATLLKIAAHAGDSVEISVVELFHKLSRKHKSNDGFSFGKRLVYTQVMGRFGVMDCEVSEALYEFQRVVDLMEGRMPAENAWMSELNQKIREAFRRDELGCETDSIRGRLFKNGNAHFFLKNQETIDKMNAIVAKRLGGNHLGRSGGK